MTIRIIEIEQMDELRKELSLIGSDKKGIELMVPKGVSRIIKVCGIKPTAANIIKQEMLSFGGEAATAYGSINHSVAATDMIIMGSLRHFDLLIKKLKTHQFGLPKLSVEIGRAIKKYATFPDPIKIGKKTFRFGKQTYIMGVLNVTPDSFSDGGKYVEGDRAVDFAKKMISEGADIIDVGGESTKPGSRPVSAAEEKKRVLPVIKKLAKMSKVPISIDTTKAEVAKAALSVGAAMVNDISGLRFDKKMAKVVAQYKVPLCIMHMQGRPSTMQRKPTYTDLLGEIVKYLSEGILIAEKAGINRKNIIIDPGIGFGKSVGHNLDIINHLKELKVLGRPILVGPSRKSLIGKVLGTPINERIEGTAVTVSLSIANGVDIVRVHDIKEIEKVVKMSDAIVRR
jgi:dihydropteroate synthase